MTACGNCFMAFYLGIFPKSHVGLAESSSRSYCSCFYANKTTAAPSSFCIMLY